MITAAVLVIAAVLILFVCKAETLYKQVSFLFLYSKVEKA